MASVLYRLTQWRSLARGARLARRDEGAYRPYSTEKQRRQTGCPARRTVLIQSMQATRLAVRGVVCVVLVHWFVPPVCAQPPSLADVAAMERERRATLDETSKVYTNDDLRGGLRLTTGSVPPQVDVDSRPAPDTAATPPDDPEATPEPDPPTRDEEYWRERITSARDGRRRAELMAAALQNRIDGLWAEFTARDNPLRRSEIEQNRNDAIQELQRTEAEVDRLSQEILDIHEETRRSGVPPGWLR